MLLQAAAEDAPPYPWKAGAAEVKITPEKPMWMAGYSSRTKPSEGVWLDLFAKALALEDADGKHFVFVTMDLIGIPRQLRQEVEDQCKAKYQLQPENLLLNASHTHSGPEFRVGESRYLEVMDHQSPEAAEYGARLVEKLVALTGEALQKLKPAKLQYTHASCGFAMNRRLPTLRGFTNSPYPDGPVDHDVPVLEVSSADGKETLAIMFGYACHNTTLSFQYLCGDYAGYAQQELQKAHPGAIALFMNGCSGDQNPYPRGKLELAQFHGKTLATAVEAALQVLQKRPLRGPIRAAYTHVDLPFAPPPSREELQELEKSKNVWEAKHATLQLKILQEQGHLETSYPYPVQVLHLNSDFVLVALGGEVVVDYSLHIKKKLYHTSVVWVAGYSNDVMAYVPSLRVLKEGGYEAASATLFTAHPGPWSDQVENTITREVYKLDFNLNIVREFPYPTEFNPPPIPANIGLDPGKK